MREFASKKGGKPQEYFVYFKVFLAHFWRKESVRIRRRNCVELPQVKCTISRHAMQEKVKAPQEVRGAEQS